MRTVESIKAKDDHTLVIKTRSPNANLLPDIDSIYIVSRHAGAAASSADYNSGKAMIGTGPYRFVSFVPGDRTVFARNDNYWGGRPTGTRLISASLPMPPTVLRPCWRAMST